MVTSARARIAQLLTGAESTGSFTAETSAPAAGVTLSVAGVGPVRFPVGAAQERKLVSVARPAMFGLGEATLIDPSVRDTWELTAEQVSLGGNWERVLEEALVEVHEGLGLPRGARLRAELHALLVYGPDQFFMPHQDSEKDDEMVATLVVSLPSVHTGGELVVSHGGQSRTYRHVDRARVGFVAFYADCLHEVRPVRTGRRVTLTFNLLVASEPEPGVTDPDDDLADLLRAHFATPVTRPWSESTSPPPNRLVVLLDHQYSQRGLAADRLKGRDVEWVGRLRAAGDRAGCLSALALAEVKQTWSAHEEDDRSWRYTYGDDDDEHGYDGGDSASYDIGELIEEEMSLGWWQRAGVGQGEQIALAVDASEVCAVTPTASLTPYESEYEGYMGNYGNTLDRWYRRAALVIWPRDRDFVARAEADLSGATAELQTRLSDCADLEEAREDARGLIGLLGSGWTGDLSQLLTVADSLDDAELAHGLLAQLAGEGLTAECAAPLAAVSARYGDAWARTLVDAWFRPSGYHSGRSDWTTSTLTALATSLTRLGAGSVAAHLCRRLWATLSASITVALTMGPRARARSMASVVPAAEALFKAADPQVSGRLVAALASYDDGIRDLELPSLRRLGVSAPPDLVADAVRRLELLVAMTPRVADDWSIVWAGCGCDLCARLQEFLADSSVVELDWPLRTDRRQHVHQRIESTELPVTHSTIRKGSPYILHLAKQRDLHEREAGERRQATADLVWLRQAQG